MNEEEFEEIILFQFMVFVMDEDKNKNKKANHLGL